MLSPLTLTLTLTLTFFGVSAHVVTTDTYKHVHTSGAIAAQTYVSGSFMGNVSFVDNISQESGGKDPLTQNRLFQRWYR